MRPFLFATRMKTESVSDLRPDEKNANRGTDRGRLALRRSLEELGAGRSVLLDKHGRLIAGNKTAEEAQEAGIHEVIVVESDGKKLVAVKRMDLDLELDPEARKLAFADNRVGELDLEWDADQVLAAVEADVDLSGLFTDDELKELEAEVNRSFEPEEEGRQPRLDRKEPVTCPNCGHEFKPR